MVGAVVAAGGVVGAVVGAAAVVGAGGWVGAGATVVAAGLHAVSSIAITTIKPKNLNVLFISFSFVNQN
jgi:hypothetical protein